jgi:large subunit ribosomal protein L23
MKPSRMKKQKRAKAKPTEKEMMHASQPRKVFTNMTKRRPLMISTAVVKHPVSSEKAIRLMESENKLVFVVDIKADKASIKHAIEDLFKVKVARVNTHIINGEKRAYVRFAAENPAIDIATNLGLM